MGCISLCENHHVILMVCDFLGYLLLLLCCIFDVVYFYESSLCDNHHVILMVCFFSIEIYI